jgi:hypothetical protein
MPTGSKLSFRVIDAHIGASPSAAPHRVRHQRAEEKPPAGTLYNYPPRHDVTAFLAGYPAPPGIGTQMATQGTICKMVAVCTQQGKSIEEAVEFVQSELEGFRRS